MKDGITGAIPSLACCQRLREVPPGDFFAPRPEAFLETLRLVLREPAFFRPPEADFVFLSVFLIVFVVLIVFLAAGFFLIGAFGDRLPAPVPPFDFAGRTDTRGFIDRRPGLLDFPLPPEVDASPDPTASPVPPPTTRHPPPTSPSMPGSSSPPPVSAAAVPPANSRSSSSGAMLWVPPSAPDATFKPPPETHPISNGARW